MKLLIRMNEVSKKMKLDSFLFWIKKVVGDFVFSVCEVTKDIKTIISNKKKPPDISRVILEDNDDEIFKGFEIEIEEEWLERGYGKNGKWKC